MKWILADRQGSVAIVTDNTGKATQRFAYDPFGNETAGAPGTGFPFRYTGQRFDPETGLYYYKARYYSPKLGRFLQTDPVGYEDQLNLYTYVDNDPTNRTDPSGTTSCGIHACVHAEKKTRPDGGNLWRFLSNGTGGMHYSGSCYGGTCPPYEQSPKRDYPQKPQEASGLPIAAGDVPIRGNIYAPEGATVIITIEVGAPNPVGPAGDENAGGIPLAPSFVTVEVVSIDDRGRRTVLYRGVAKVGPSDRPSRTVIGVTVPGGSAGLEVTVASCDGCNQQDGTAVRVTAKIGQQEVRSN